MAQLELSKKEFKRFRDLIAGRTGIYFDLTKQDLLNTHLLQRMQDCGLIAFSDYFKLIDSPAGKREFDYLLNLITIPETYFFRDQAQFNALKSFVIPEVLKKKSRFNSPLRIWSAGCSTGEEPYTIAMILAELSAGVVDPESQILATDVSHAALEAARRGVYGTRSVRNVPEEYIRSFFTQRGDSYSLDESIIKMVEFRYFNLMTEPYPLQEMSGWDIIFCRNVTIYFQQESTRKVIHNFYQSLQEGGYLFAGYSESLRYLSDEFATVQIGGVFLYQKATPERKARQQKARQKRRLRRRPYVETSKREVGVRPTSNKETEKIEQICSKAKELLEMGQPDKASELLAPYLAESTPPESVVQLQAEIALNQGELEKAAVLCQRIIKNVPLPVAGHFLLGIVYRTWERENEAIEEFKKAVYLNPEHALARFNLGDLYSRVGQIDEAKLEYANVVRLLSEVPDSLDERFAGGFSPTLLIDTCRSRIRDLESKK